MCLFKPQKTQSVHEMILRKRTTKFGYYNTLNSHISQQHQSNGSSRSKLGFRHSNPPEDDWSC